jgi:hypothetical protein
MTTPTYEARFTIAIEAIQGSTKLSIKTASKLYNVKHATLYDRLDSWPIRYDIPTNSKKLTLLEKESIVQYILEFIVRSFPPRLCDMKDIANQLLHTHDQPPVGKL